MTEQIHIEVVYGLPNKQELIALPVAVGTTIEQAIQESGILSLFDDIDFNFTKTVITFPRFKNLLQNLLGIFNIVLNDFIDTNSTIEDHFKFVNFFLINLINFINIPIG